ncbi:MAG: glycosyl hydrolase [Lachnospiraceae bacterium]
MEQLKKYMNPEIQFWPEVRWWLAEGFHTDETLKKDINLLYDSGFGAIEFLAMEELGADSKIYGWGAEEWVHDSHIMIEETTKRGMGVSMTSGTNWSNANLITINPDDKAAAKELDYIKETLSPGQSRQGKLLRPTLKVADVTKQELLAVVAIKFMAERDGKTFLDKDSSIVLTNKVENGELNWTAPKDGIYELFYFWIHGTGQTAGPSVSTSYTVNYLDDYGIKALIDYWNRTVLTSALKENIGKNARAMMYMDSLELATYGNGGQLWGYHLVEEFMKRRGYDLVPYLPFVVKEAGMMQPVFHYHYNLDDEIFAEKLYNDLYQTMTDLYMDNMLKPMQKWLHVIGMKLRAEISYGLPFEISQPGKYVDGIETESLEFASQIEPYRNLAGPAHIYNRIYSSETGATKLNYIMGLDFYTQIIYTQFAAGVSKTVLHGYSSIAGSEESTHWPGHEGMWPIFSERFGVRQPSFVHYNDWTKMIARYQMILREGKPRIDLGILRLDYNFNNMYICDDEKGLYESMLMRNDEGVYWKDMQLQHNGYTWDYFAPQILEEEFVDYSCGELLPNGPGYRGLVIYQEVMPIETAEKLLAMAKRGLPIVFVNGVTETIRPGGVNKTHKKAAMKTPFNDGKDHQLNELIAAMKGLKNVLEVHQQSETYQALQSLGVYPRAAYEEANKDMLTTMREDDTYVYLYIYNMKYTQKQVGKVKVVLDVKGCPYIINCWTGDIKEVACYVAEFQGIRLDVELAPGEALIYAIEKDKERRHIEKSNVWEFFKDEEQIYAKCTETGTYKISLSDGVTTEFTVSVPDNFHLDKWHLVVEDWNEGDKKIIEENRGLGYVTKEVYYETQKTKLDAGEVTLKAWKDIPQIGPEVSGVALYTTNIVLPSEWSDNNGAVLKIESLNGNTAAITVNGVKAAPIDINSRQVDISSLVCTGENTISVEVSSTLNNRLLARGFFDEVEESSKILSGNANNVFEDESSMLEELSFTINSKVQSYGMVGSVELITYVKVRI